MLRQRKRTAVSDTLVSKLPRQTGEPRATRVARDFIIGFAERFYVSSDISRTAHPLPVYDFLSSLYTFLHNKSLLWFLLYHRRVFCHCLFLLVQSGWFSANILGKQPERFLRSEITSFLSILKALKISCGVTSYPAAFILPIINCRSRDFRISALKALFVSIISLNSFIPAIEISSRYLSGFTLALFVRDLSSHTCRWFFLRLKGRSDCFAQN